MRSDPRTPGPMMANFHMMAEAMLYHLAEVFIFSHCPALNCFAPMLSTLHTYSNNPHNIRGVVSMYYRSAISMERGSVSFNDISHRFESNLWQVQGNVKHYCTKYNPWPAQVA